MAKELRMGHSLGDALIVAAIAGAVVAWMYFKHRERHRRLDVLHAERLAAMDKGIPLPELPLEPPARPPDPTEPLMHGIVWLALGAGGMLALLFAAPLWGGGTLWPLPLPLALLGLGLVLYYFLASARER
jgi:hypothetical protein